MATGTLSLTPGTGVMASPSENSANPSHTWLAAGTYTVTVSASDMKGGSATASMNVTVTDILSQWTEQTAFAGARYV